MNKRMADVAEKRRADLSESVKFMGLQTKLWRAAAVIISHHPEVAKGIVTWMAINSTLVGETNTLTAYSEHWIVIAMRCGRASGVFDDEGEVCDGEIPKLAPEIPKKEGDRR